MLGPWCPRRRSRFAIASVSNASREGAAFPPAGAAPGDELRLRLAGLKALADGISKECGIVGQTF